MSTLSTLLKHTDVQRLAHDLSGDVHCRCLARATSDARQRPLPSLGAALSRRRTACWTQILPSQTTHHQTAKTRKKTHSSQTHRVPTCLLFMRTTSHGTCYIAASHVLPPTPDSGHSLRWQRLCRDAGLLAGLKYCRHKRHIIKRQRQERKKTHSSQTHRVSTCLLFMRTTSQGTCYIPCQYLVIANGNVRDLVFRPPSRISFGEPLKTKRGSKSKSLFRMQTSTHGTSTATTTKGSRLNHATHGAHPSNPSCFFAVPVQSRSREDAKLELLTLSVSCTASISSSLCEIPVQDA